MQVQALCNLFAIRCSTIGVISRVPVTTGTAVVEVPELLSALRLPRGPFMRVDIGHPLVVIVPNVVPLLEPMYLSYT